MMNSIEYTTRITMGFGLGQCPFLILKIEIEISLFLLPKIIVSSFKQTVAPKANIHDCVAVGGGVTILWF